VIQPFIGIFLCSLHGESSFSVDSTLPIFANPVNQTAECGIHYTKTLTDCQRNGHILRKTLSLGERLCTRCGKKVYRPACTSTIPQGATLIYCLQHDPLEAGAIERSVRS
jgi:hypothetical protein